MKTYWYNEFEEVCGAVEGDDQQKLKNNIIKALFEGGEWKDFGNIGDKIEVVEE